MGREDRGARLPDVGGLELLPLPPGLRLLHPGGGARGRGAQCEGGGSPQGGGATWWLPPSPGPQELREEVLEHAPGVLASYGPMDPRCHLNKSSPYKTYS